MHTATESTGRHPVVLYGRVSQSRDPQSKSVDDQLCELRRWSSREGWHVIGEFRDDGVSASRYAGAKTREGWHDVVTCVRSGKLRGGALLLWEFSRATRDDEVAARLQMECVRAGVKIGYHGQLRDPSTSDGFFGIGLDALLAARESIVTSERVRRSVESRAAKGRPHGSLPYGYRVGFDRKKGVKTRELHPDQAPIVAEIVKRLLSHEPAEAIARDLNRRGVPTARGGVWTGGNLSKLAIRPTYAGLRVHHGEVLDVHVSWPAIITTADHYRLKSLYNDPNRDKYRNSTHVKHLGVGLFRCGREDCDGRMRVVIDAGNRGNRYDCRKCHRVSRLQGPVDNFIEKIVVARLGKPDVLSLLAHADDEEIKRASDEVAEIQGRLSELRVAWKDGKLSLAEYVEMRESMQPDLDDAMNRARPKNVPDALMEVVGATDVYEKWGQLPIDKKRVVIDSLLRVTILPIGRGGPRNGRNKVAFDPSTIRVEWA